MAFIKFHGAPDVEEKVEEWLRWDKNEETRREILDLVDKGAEEELRTCLMNRLEFGTAGLRGRMGPGYGSMNDLVIIQTSQGLASYLTQKTCPSKGVIIGYDGRHNSKRFAELTGVAMLNRGFKVYLFSDICPTPFVPFAVTLFQATAGIMVTASHNPKEDNGYKVYWDNGAQIVTPVDKEIQANILKNLEPWEGAWDISRIQSTSVQDPLAQVCEEYYEKLKSATLYPQITSETNVRFTYTPMHGVGQNYMVKAFDSVGLKSFHSVEEQKDADPEFPTVKFPNPEEGKSALDLAIRTADRHGSIIILANDPDADRLAVAEKQPNSEWKIFNGNELGALMGWWALHSYTQNHPNQRDLSNVYMIASTVSSKFLQTMAQKEGFNFVETLTGFKWMGNKAFELLNEGCEVLFAFEEAIGFMNGTSVLDKDGISAGVRLAELAAFLYSKSSTLNDHLSKLYDMYGYHVSDNSYFICHEQETIKEIFNNIRNFSCGENNLDCAYPVKIGELEIMATRDLTTGFDSEQEDNKAVLPVSKSSQMITFKFNNGLVATLRTSGTEPKVKYYTELRAPPSEKDRVKVTGMLKDMVETIVGELLKPAHYGLIPRTN